MSTINTSSPANVPPKPAAAVVDNQAAIRELKAQMNGMFADKLKGGAGAALGLAVRDGLSLAKWNGIGLAGWNVMKVATGQKRPTQGVSDTVVDTVSLSVMTGLSWLISLPFARALATRIPAMYAVIGVNLATYSVMDHFYKRSGLRSKASTAIEGMLTGGKPVPATSKVKA